MKLTRKITHPCPSQEGTFEGKPSQEGTCKADGNFSNFLYSKIQHSSIFFLLILTAFIFGVYFNTFKNVFLWDDLDLIVNNAFIKNSQNLKLLFSKDYFILSGELSYRPLCTLSYFLDYYLWGFNVFGYHLFNITLHTINTILLFFCLRLILQDRQLRCKVGQPQCPVPTTFNFLYLLNSQQITNNPTIFAFISALIFAVHPVHTEAINGITFREDILFACFYLISFLSYIKIQNTEHRTQSTEHRAQMNCRLSIENSSNQQLATNNQDNSAVGNHQITKLSNYQIATSLQPSVTTNNHLQNTDSVSNQQSAIENQKSKIKNPTLHSAPYIIICCSAYFLSLFSKETAITFPVICLVYEFILLKNNRANRAKCKVQSAKYKKRRSTKYEDEVRNVQSESDFRLQTSDFGNRESSIVNSRSITFLCLIFLSFFYLFVRFKLMMAPKENIIYHGDSFYLTMLTMSKVLLYYIKMLFIPIKFCIEYDIALSKSIFEPLTFLSISFIFLLILLIIWSFKNSKLLCFSLIWFLVNFLPVSNIIPISVFMAERYMYLPSLSYTVLIGMLIYKLLNSKQNIWKIFSALLFLTIVILFSFITLNRNKIWKSEISFWRNAKSCAPASAKVRNNLALSYDKKGELTNAINEYKNAIKLSARTVVAKDRYGVLYRAHSNLGITYSKKQMFPEAIEHYKKAIEINPQYPNAYFNLGVTYYNMKFYDDAVLAFKNGLKFAPNNLTAKAYLDKIYGITKVESE